MRTPFPRTHGPATQRITLATFLAFAKNYPLRDLNPRYRIEKTEKMGGVGLRFSRQPVARGFARLSTDFFTHGALKKRE